MWNTKSIEGMEQTAEAQTDNNCNKVVNGRWLEVVCYAANGPVDTHYKYLYNNKQINRETAIKLLEVGR